MTSSHYQNIRFLELCQDVRDAVSKLKISEIQHLIVKVIYFYEDEMITRQQYDRLMHELVEVGIYKYIVRNEAGDTQ